MRPRPAIGVNKVVDGSSIMDGASAFCTVRQLVGIMFVVLGLEKEVGYQHSGPAARSSALSVLHPASIQE